MPDFDFYRDVYLGQAIDGQDAFDRLVARAEELLRRAERVWRVEYLEEDARERAVCAAAESLKRGEARDGEPVIRSTTAGNMSVTYERTPVGDADSPEAVYRILSLYAEVYRGLGG